MSSRVPSLVGAVVLLSLLAAPGGTPTINVPQSPPFVHMHTPRLACLGTMDQPVGCVRLSEGYYFDEPTYDRLDAEVKRLQDAETRLRAENDSLRKSAQAWQPGWLTVVTAAVTGAVLAIYVERRL